MLISKAHHDAMKARTTTILIILGMFVLIILAVIGSQVGGIAIRSNATRPERPTLTISSPVVRGTPVTIRWNIPTGANTRPITVNFRDQAGEQTLTTTTLTAATATVTFPCAVNGTSGSIILRAADTDAVMSAETVALLPPTQDCIRF